MNKVAKFFKLEENNTTIRMEVIAGLTTFMTMAYVLVVQPLAIIGGEESIIDINGVVITKEALMISTALISAIFTFIMGLYTNLPFALSTGMGVNFLFGGLIQSGEMSFGSVIAITTISGVIFLLLTIFGIRDLIVRMIPKNIKVSIGTAVGFFIAYLGFANSGIGNFTNGISMGDFTTPSVFLAIAGLLLIAALSAHGIKGSILISIIAITIVGIPFGVTTLPNAIIKMPDFGDVSNIMFNWDFKSVLTVATIPLIFTAFVSDFFSTLGTVLGVASKAEMLDDEGNLPGIEKPFLVDSIATIGGAAMGGTVVTTFVESSAGVEAGGKTGLTAITTAISFLLTIFIAPLFIIVPSAATAPALIYIGFLMIKEFKNIDFDDFSESFGPFVLIMFTIFTGSIASGIAAGIIAYVFIKVVTGKFKEIHPALYILAIPLILYFVL